MTNKIIYDVESRQIVHADNLGPSGGMSFDRLASLLQQHECRGTERLTAIVFRPDIMMLELRFKEGKRI
jgi:hypothetical protein